MPTWWTQRPDEFPLLTGWLGGPKSKVAPKEIAELYDKAERSLCYILNCQETVIRSQIRHWHVSDWNKDPHQFGAYTYPMVRTAEVRKFLSVPVDDTIYFAGEGIHNGESSGTVEAAVASGLNVVQDIILSSVRE